LLHICNVKKITAHMKAIGMPLDATPTRIYQGKLVQGVLERDSKREKGGREGGETHKERGREGERKRERGIERGRDQGVARGAYRGDSLIRNTPLLGPYSSTWGHMMVLGGGLFLMSEVPL